MRSVLIAHVADTHLGYRQYGLYERELDLYEAFDAFAEHAIREHVDIVVHAGDFFDTPRPPPQALRAALRVLKKLKEHKIPVVTVLGDHDIPKRRGEHPLTLFEELGLVRVLLHDKSSTLKLETRSGCTVFIAGLPHHRLHAQQKLKLRLAGLRPPPEQMPKILVLHQGLEQFSPEPQLALEDLPPGYSYYALGHVHRPSASRAPGGGVVVYSGSIDALRLDEAAYEHGFVIAEVYVDDADYTFVELEGRRPQLLYRIEYEKIDEELKRIASGLKTDSKKPLLHLVVEGRRIDRKRVYRLVHEYLSAKTLYTHLVIREKGVSETTGIDTATGRLDRLELLQKLLGDRELASLADRLIDAVAAGASEAELMHLVEEYYRRRYGGSGQ